MAHTRKAVTMSVVLALGMAIFLFLQLQSIGASSQVSLISALVMGLVMASIAMLSYAYRAHLNERAMTGKKQAHASQDELQTRTIEIDLPFAQAFALALQAVKTLDQQMIPVPEDSRNKLDGFFPRKQLLRIHEQDASMGMIRAGLRARLFGITDVVEFSQIRLQLQRVDDQTTRIRVDSTPHMIDLFDMGRNLHYVNQLALYLRRESQTSDAESRLSLDSDDDDQHMTDDTDPANQRYQQD